jgi:hypothetical protein
VIRTHRFADGSAEVTADVAVGVETRTVSVPLGPYRGDVDPAGLRNTPVVVLTSEALEPTVRAGVARAGSATVLLVRVGAGDRLGAGLLGAAESAEVLTLVTSVDAAAEALVVVRALRGRPLPVVPFDDRAAAGRMLEGCWVDLDVAIPSIDGSRREEARRVGMDAGIFSAHHVVEVDPRAGLDERDPDAPTLHELAAAAAGVLAGRIASGNRRWR